MRERRPDAFWMGVDLGTQSVRAVIADDNGAVIALGSAPLSGRQDGSARRHEQNAEVWWKAVGRATRQAFAAVAKPVQISAIAVCSTSGTVLLTDNTGAAVTPALMYDDARAVDEYEALLDAGADVTGSDQVQLSWALPKVSWLLRHADRSGPPDAYVAHSADYVAASLVGHRVATDSSHALKSGYDIVTERWNLPLLDAAGVDPKALPSVVRPGTALGTVTEEAAEHTGIPVGTPVVAGMTDGCAAQIAAGSLEPGSWNSVLGTTLVLKGVSDQLIVDSDGAVYCHRHPDHGWLPGGASNVGAGYLSSRFPGRDLDDLSELATRFEPSAGVIYPLAAPGERFPFVRPDAIRFQVGVTVSEAEEFAAILQSVCLVERLCFERLEALGADVSGQVSITGGATKNPYWSQLRSDVLDRPLAIPAIPEPSFGMAVLASAQHESVTARSRRMVRRTGTVEPRTHMRGRFDHLYGTLIDELVRRGYVAEGFAAEPVRGGK